MQATVIIAFCFKHYDEIKKAVADKINDPGNVKTGGGNRHMRISDPTAIQGIRNAMGVDRILVEYGPSVCGHRETFPLRHPSKWLKVVEFTKEFYQGKIQCDLIRLHFEQNVPRDEILAQLNIGRSLYHVLCNDIFCFATGVAMGMDLVPRKK